MPPRKFGRRLIIAAVVAGLTGPAVAQDIDQGKPAPKLFADTCAACHRSARGLAKGRFSLTLYLYLQKHYASNSSSAWALTSYLESVDAPKPAPSRAAARPSGVTTGRAGSAPRPPMPVPTR
jgi:mono/diheme cytochrome c family protein